VKGSRSILGFSIVLLGALSVGCAGHPVQFHNAVPAGIDRSGARQVEGSASGLQLLHFIPIGTNSRHARAYQQLLAEAGDAYVTDVKMREGWWYALVGTIYRTTFQATAYPKSGRYFSGAPEPGPSRGSALAGADAGIPSGDGRAVSAPAGPASPTRLR
jgi:hypothetical protein